MTSKAFKFRLKPNKFKKQSRWFLEILVGMGHAEPDEKSSNACGDATIGDQAYAWSRYVSQEQIGLLDPEAAILSVVSNSLNKNKAKFLICY